jgi:hypothetical protein
MLSGNLSPVYPAAGEWQPISEAPKDGQYPLLAAFNPDGTFRPGWPVLGKPDFGCERDETWIVLGSEHKVRCFPTHFALINTPPEEVAVRKAIEEGKK